MDPLPKPQENKIEVPSTLSSVNVRTMESDLESMKTTGGTHPVPQVVDTAPVFENEAPIKEDRDLPPPPVPNTTHWGWFWLILGFIVLFLVGYFILPLFL